MKNTGWYQLIFLILIISSCDDLFDFHKDKKYLSCNSENCYLINITGKISDKVKNVGIKGISVTFKWEKPLCWFCHNTIDVNSSDQQGIFAFHKQIDTTYFMDGYHLKISIPDNKDYIILPYSRQISIYNLSEIDSNDFKFEFYPKTELQIELNRVQSDTFKYFEVEHSFRDGLDYNDFVFDMGEIENNKTIISETAAGSKTYIKWGKTSGNGRTTNIDSVICKKGILNKYRIDY